MEIFKGVYHMEGKVQLEITYCVPWQHHATATWMANEFFRAYGPDAAITISPRGQGIMEVFLDGEKIFDKKAEGNTYPDLARVRKMKEVIAAKISTVEPVAADD